VIALMHHLMSGCVRQFQRIGKVNQSAQPPAHH
jgi:hypothetical protein